MIDIRLAREHPDLFRRALARKGAAADFDELLGIDVLWRDLTTEVDELRRKTRPRGKPTEEERAALVVLSQELRRAESELEDLDPSAARKLLIALPNPPDDSAPDGYSDEGRFGAAQSGQAGRVPVHPRDHVS